MHSANSTSRAGFLRPADHADTMAHRADILAAVFRCLAVHEGREVSASEVMNYVMGALDCREEEASEAMIILALLDAPAITSSTKDMMFSTTVALAPGLREFIRHGSAGVVVGDISE